MSFYGTVDTPAPHRPAKIVVAAILLIILGALAALPTLVSLVGALSVAVTAPGADGTNLGAAVAGSISPIVAGVLAIVAGVGIIRRRRWGLWIGVVLATLAVALGAWLLWVAIADWSAPGSFAALLVPPGVLYGGAGLFIVYALVSERQVFD